MSGDEIMALAGQCNVSLCLHNNTIEFNFQVVTWAQKFGGDLFTKINSVKTWNQNASLDVDTPSRLSSLVLTAATPSSKNICSGDAH